MKSGTTVAEVSKLYYLRTTVSVVSKLTIVMIINRKFWWIIALLWVVVLAFALDLPLVSNAAKYAQVSREITQSGDWINLSIAGEAYDQKPPLLFWVGALFFHLLGISTPVWKLASLLVSLLGIYATFRLGKLLYGQRAGELAALFWAVSLGFLHFHNDIHTDTMLTDMVIFSIWQLAAFFKEKNPVHFYLGMAGTGLSMLVKGPVGLVIPATAAGLHLLLHKNWKEILHSRWIIGGVIIMAIITPALAGLYNQFGAEGIKFYFWTNNMGRITGSYYGSNSDPSFYLHTSLFMLAPFTVFAFGGVAATLMRTIRAKGKFLSTDEFYTLGGLIPYFLLLSVAKTKNPHYLLPVMPLLMILAGSFAVALASGKTGRKTGKYVALLNTGMTILIWTIIPLVTLWLFPEKRPLFWILLLLMGSVMMLLRHAGKGIYRQVVTLTITALALVFTLNASLFPAMGKFHSPLQAAATFNTKAATDEKIHCYLPPSRYWDLFFYSKNPGYYFKTEEELPALLENNHDWVFTDDAGKEQILAEMPEAEVVETYRHKSLSSVSLPFLYPPTREKKIKNRYLLHLNRPVDR